MLVDLRPARLTGKEMERRLDEVNITVNKNAIPNDPEKPFVTSGIRVGTPAATTRGFKEADMEVIASIMWRTPPILRASRTSCGTSWPSLPANIPCTNKQNGVRMSRDAACRKMASAGRRFSLDKRLLNVVYL